MIAPVRTVLLLASVALPQLARAAGAPFDPVAAAAAVAPYLDEQTIAVARIDLSRIDPDAILDKWAELMPNIQRDADDLRPMAKILHGAFTGAGFTEAYVLISFAEVPVRSPLVVVPKNPGADGGQLASKLSELLRSHPALRVSAGDDAVLIGSAEGLARIGKLQADPRPHLSAALEAAGDHAIQLVVLPTDNDRRVVEELMPELPAYLGGAPSTVVTRGVHWLALGLDTPPQASLSFTVQSADAAAAESLAKAWGQAAAALAGSDDPLLPPIGAVVKLLAPSPDDDRLAVHFGGGELPALLAAAKPPLAALQLAHWRRISSYNLKQVGLGILNFDSAKGRLPAIGSFDASGQPLLSWRVHILPYMERMDLYKQFHLDEPWDSEHNRQLISQMPEVFRSPVSKHRALDGLATYREVIGEHTAFPGREGIVWKQVKDGTANTILVVEVDDDHAVVWTKPEGLPFNAAHPSAGMGGQFPGGINAAFMDAHFKFLEMPAVDDAKLRALLTIDGGEPITWETP